MRPLAVILQVTSSFSTSRLTSRLDSIFPRRHPIRLPNPDKSCRPHQPPLRCGCIIRRLCVTRLRLGRESHRRPFPFPHLNNDNCHERHLVSARSSFLPFLRSIILASLF